MGAKSNIQGEGARSSANPKSAIPNVRIHARGGHPVCSASGLRHLYAAALRPKFSFAVLVVPEFALQAAGRLEKPVAGRASVLMEEAGRKAIVMQVDARARAAGVEPGMTAPQAVARCPEAMLLNRSPQAEKLAREALVAAAFTFSPRVEETAGGVCTVDLKGTCREKLVQHGHCLVEELKKLGLDAQIGLARNPLLALFAARRAEPVLEVRDEAEFLSDLPLAVADPPPRVAGILEQWGVKTLGALTALPRQEIARRLGEEGIALWDRAAGRGERVLRLTVLPETFEEAMELEREMETLEPLLFILRRFIGQLTLRLSAVYKVTGEVRLELGLSDKSSYERTFRLPEPTCNPDLLFRMLHTHLEGVRTEFPIVRIYLRMEACRPVSRQADLFSAAVKDAYAFTDTLARLVAVVGSGNVGSPRLEPTHRPDAFRLEPLAATDVRRWSVEETNDDIRPPPHVGGYEEAMRRFRPPVSAQVWVENGRPAYVRSDVMEGRIQKTGGPWRLSGDWWDQHRWAREEWDIATADGGRYRLVREGKRWFVEGEYG